MESDLLLGVSYQEGDILPLFSYGPFVNIWSNFFMNANNSHLQKQRGYNEVTINALILTVEKYLQISRP